MTRIKGKVCLRYPAIVIHHLSQQQINLFGEALDIIIIRSLECTSFIIICYSDLIIITFGTFV